jgi:UV DNA damage endonuclease
VAIVLDIHHHFISDHEYISALDDRITHIIDSWRGVRPVIHYSQSREEYLSEFNECVPSMDVLLGSTKKGKLRAHSDFYSNTYINNWARTHWEWADIMAECKAKNLGSLQLFGEWTK